MLVYQESGDQMPFHYQIDVQRRILFTTGEGIVTDADLRKLQIGLQNESDFQPGFSELINLQAVTSVEITGDGLRTIYRSDLFSKDSRRAIFAPTDVLYGMSRMYQIIDDDSDTELHVFRDMAEARKWLGLEEVHPS